MRRGAWFLFAALPLCAQTPRITHGQLDTRSLTGGLESTFRQFLASQPQPSWVGYSVPGGRGDYAWCTPGVVRLEPPDQMLVLLRIDSGRLDQIRTLSPDCEIDAGGAPVHWLNGVRPGDSVALLSSFARDEALGGNLRDRAFRAIANSGGQEAVDALVAMARSGSNPRWRRQAASALARSNDPRARQFFEDVLKH